ncbi:MAG TPA: hypothetical protein VKT77_04135 [Chthonomonadaceae bacterium]|nr:hypothetical protein [Chthonomonadaceae bacterium]
MLRRTIVDQSAYPAPAYAPYAPAPRGVEAAQAQIEDYLDHYCAPLVGSVPYEERLRLREEMQTQIESMAAAHVELGSTREQAVALTLRQFGHAPFVAPAQSGPQLRQAAPVKVEAHARPRGVGFGVFAFGLAMFLQAMTIASMRNSDTGGGLAALVMMAAFPFLAGLALGYRRPDRTLRVMLRSMCWLVIPSLFATLIAMSDGHADAVFAMALVGSIGNILFGGIGARMGASFRRSGLMEKIDPPFDVSAVGSRPPNAGPYGSAFGGQPPYRRSDEAPYRMP